ncbi:hypothetical protein GOBAR_AA38849 [Gossypium barbadense]|uniref:Uncharacterized protein n=1 Tax=Gossypium barbadense TaxID=3634 RepID=A0A2P5VSP5_GOSBA|nr:hypothetical protein GOBAR_AA38849 [Gossypium barbadense]
MDEVPAEKLSFKDKLLLNTVLVESDNAWPGAVGFELGEEDVVVENAQFRRSIFLIGFIILLMLAGRLQLIGFDNEYFLSSLGVGTCPLRNYILLTLLPALPNRYYTKSIFRAIANVIGKVIKIDYNTTEGKRGHFAHLAESYVHKDADKGNRASIAAAGEGCKHTGNIR